MPEDLAAQPGTERGSVLPAGTVTVLAAASGPAPERIDAAAGAHGGRRSERRPGAGAVAAVAAATDALEAAVELRRALGPATRLALHTGEARLDDDGGYRGATVRRCVRLRDVARAGQTLLTSATASTLGDALPAGASLRDLGQHRLRDLSHPERVFELRDATAGDEQGPALDSLDAHPNNLPIQLTSFVGREAELEAVHRLLGGADLVGRRGARAVPRARQQVRPWFTLDPSNAAAVRTMCARLDGIPLALELAAAWLRTLTPLQIEAGLDDRFALLVRGPRGAAARQQTLLASIDWSHDLLDEPDRIVLRRLAVFAGGFDLDAARAVCGGAPVGSADVLGSLGRLVDKSLVVAEDRDGRARFRLLETIRRYADDRLREAGEADAARDRHLDRQLALVEAAEPELHRDREAWRAPLELEHDNLRAALEWGLAAADPERGRRLAAGLPWLWNLHGHGHEGMEFLQGPSSPTPRSA